MLSKKEGLDAKELYEKVRRRCRPLTRARVLTLPSSPSLQSGCVERTVQLGGASLLAGAVAGAISASWHEGAHSGVERSTYTAVVKDVGRGVGRMSLLFGVAGAIFAATECGAQTFRGRSDWVNQAWGACAAGASVGLMSRSPAGTVAGCVVMGFLGTVFSLLPVVDRNDNVWRKS